MNRKKLCSIILVLGLTAYLSSCSFPLIEATPEAMSNSRVSISTLTPSSDFHPDVLALNETRPNWDKYALIESLANDLLNTSGFVVAGSFDGFDITLGEHQRTISRMLLGYVMVADAIRTIEANQLGLCASLCTKANAVNAMIREGTEYTMMCAEVAPPSSALLSGIIVNALSAAYWWLNTNSIQFPLEYDAATVLSTIELHADFLCGPGLGVRSYHEYSNETINLPAAAIHGLCGAYRVTRQEHYLRKAELIFREVIHYQEQDSGSGIGHYRAETRYDTDHYHDSGVCYQTIIKRGLANLLMLEPGNVSLASLLKRSVSFWAKYTMKSDGTKVGFRIPTKVFEDTQNLVNVYPIPQSTDDPLLLIPGINVKDWNQYTWVLSAAQSSPHFDESDRDYLMQQVLLVSGWNPLTSDKGYVFNNGCALRNILATEDGIGPFDPTYNVSDVSDQNRIATVIENDNPDYYPETQLDLSRSGTAPSNRRYISTNFVVQALTAGDYDGDGFEDDVIVAFHRRNTNEYYIYEPSEDLFAPGTGGKIYDSTVAGNRKVNTLATIPDIDGDGIDELITSFTDNVGTHTIHLDYGGDDADSGNPIYTSPTFKAEFFVVGEYLFDSDLSGTDTADVMTFFNKNGSYYIYLRELDGGGTPAANYVGRIDRPIYDVAGADLDGDGVREFIVAVQGLSGGTDVYRFEYGSDFSIRDQIITIYISSDTEDYPDQNIYTGNWVVTSLVSYENRIRTAFWKSDETRIYESAFISGSINAGTGPKTYFSVDATCPIEIYDNYSVNSTIPAMVIVE